MGHRNEPPYDVLVVGAAGVDTIVRVPRLEVPDADLLHVPPIRDYVAHTGTGAALGFHALGLRTHFLDFLGEDLQGDLIRRRFTSAGLGFDVLPAPNGTPRSVNLVDEAGRRFSFYDGRHPADLLLPPEFVGPHLDRARHVHVCRSGFNRELFGELERRGLPSSTDLHAWDGVNPDSHPWAFRTDYVFLSAAGLRGRIEETLRLILERGKARLAVATDGERGCHLLSREGDGAVQHFPAVTPAAPVVDSNGAGDAFVTAFLYTLFTGGDLGECARAGTVSGAFACTQVGTHERQMTAAELAAELAGAEGGDGAAAVSPA
ncbi:MULTISPECIES: carbohydrate kinase family protein [unclassified Streptomyces]|jgi:sugar/nucleoside kinase (ribokinase family)|uniref:carbohydrate kinase family protein n=1 Tax=Streptomyces TaxID=1883 RepID=UPI001905FFD1|nr:MULTISPECIES: PfkB family carbohydrate kinase [unclassified Streptomyces]MCU4746479.1 PfkB family carbohydrate kinase [Streptomyces sp. G-5]QQN76753.1 carbohydrate kinase family protein [Streptomyces sp. XC 2026]